MEEKIKITAGLLLLMLILGTADIALVEGFPSEQPSEPTTTGRVDTNTPKPSKPLPPGGVAKFSGPNIEKLLSDQGFRMAEAREDSILQRVVPEGVSIETHVMLRKGDRAGLIAWVNSPDVKRYYIVLKEALHSAFTPDVRDLLDETQRREGRPTRNLLTFFDPGIAPERVVFVRVRERLYEIRVSEGSSTEVFNLIEELTK
ncbi:MAG: hypothetical protein QF442_03795 [Candidatus Peribacteraceae bacterium]|jgi:hypothetical protein|nr:hypothetical protein [Candidatus Peribacteraceae bacterium]